MPAAIRMQGSDVRESDILRQVLALDPLNLVLWRNTRGKTKNKYGAWLTYGVGPNGASDAIGYRVIRITPDMVGKRIAQFTAVETKRPKLTADDDQQAFIDNVNASGGLAGCVTSVEEAMKLLGVLA